MNNSFVFSDTGRAYDLIVIIPTLPRPENQKRLAEVIKLIESFPPSKWSWNIYLAYEGSDWGDAVNIAITRLRERVTKGFILLDDDDFPMRGWLDGIEGYAIEYPDSLFQFSMLINGKVYWTPRVYRLGPLAMALSALCFYHRAQTKKHIPLYFLNADYKYRSSLPASPRKILHACTSAIFIPLSVYDAIGQIAVNENINYCEDTDYSFRAWMNGFQVYRIPGRVRHFIGTTKSTKSPEYVSKISYSQLWLYGKWFTQRAFVEKITQEGFLESRGVAPKLTWAMLKNIFYSFLFTRNSSAAE